MSDSDDALFGKEEVGKVVRAKGRGKLPPNRHGGLHLAADPQPNPGRYERVGDHLLRVGLTDEDGNPLGRHTASCSCGWEQEKFHAYYDERTAWVEAFGHTGIDWSSGRVLIEPPFDQAKANEGTGKADKKYLKAIQDNYGDKEGPYLTLTQTCQQSARIDPPGQLTAHMCVGVVFGRGDGAPDDRVGICMDACHSMERLPRLCGGLQENGCRKVGTHPRGELPEGWPDLGDNPPMLELCATHWAEDLAREAARAERAWRPVEERTSAPGVRRRPVASPSAKELEAAARAAGLRPDPPAVDTPGPLPQAKPAAMPAGSVPSHVATEPAVVRAPAVLEVEPAQLKDADNGQMAWDFGL